MELLVIFLGVSAAYFLGSIPVSVIISKFHFGIDIREHGKGNASHSNVSDVLGKRAGWIVRILDISKGYFSLGFLCLLQAQWGVYDVETMEIMRMSFGLAVILGHVFPLWAKFKGGRGVHVAIGVMLILIPQASAFCILLAIAAWMFTHNKNLAYIIGSAALPLFMLLGGRHFTEFYVSMLVFSFLLFIFLFATHAKDLRIRKFDRSILQ